MGRRREMREREWKVKGLDGKEEGDERKRMERMRVRWKGGGR
jgi:hypothetical protein